VNASPGGADRPVDVVVDGHGDGLPTGSSVEGETTSRRSLDAGSAQVPPRRTRPGAEALHGPTVSERTLAFKRLRPLRSRLMAQLPLAGVRVLEVASHVFVPAATALLAEWGAEVLKVEHPDTGDAYRGLITAGLHRSFHGVDVQFQHANRSKRSLGIDLSTDAGRALLHRLAAGCDVFVTSHRPSVRARLGIDVESVRTANPTIVYASGSGYGAEGPDADRGAYDHAAYWARTGIAHRFTPEGDDPGQPPPAFGDYAAALAAAAGIASALYRRATTGEGSEVDVSLLGVGLWQLQPDVVDGALGPPASAGSTRPSRHEVPNPLVNVYRTRDDRHLSLVMIDADRQWANLCEVIGAPELLATLASPTRTPAVATTGPAWRRSTPSSPSGTSTTGAVSSRPPPGRGPRSGDPAR
jgi:crotonobetainyl-CoA:carnitine CoA-transferase CaiB-like acyl-CoA transferase